MSTDARPKRTRKDPGERAAEILAAATALARADGLAALTVRSIADRAGVTQGLVAHYFPSMPALVARIYRDLVGAEVDELRAALEREPDAGDRIRALLATVLDGTRDDVTVLWVEGWALGRRNPELAAAVREQMDAWHALVAGAIAAAVDAGVVRVDDVDRAAWQLLAFVDGLNAQSLVRDTAPDAFVGDAVAAVETLLGMGERADR